MVNFTTLARTVSRLRFGQVAWRAIARISQFVTPRISGPLPIQDGAIDRLVEWAARTSLWSRTAVQGEAERALAGLWRYVGVTVESPLPPVKGPFPSRLWGYEFHYRRWLEGLAHLARQGNVPRELPETWRALSEAESGREAWEPYVLARRLWSEATAAGLLRDENALRPISLAAGALSRMPEIHIAANHLLADRGSVAAMAILLAPQAPATKQRILDYLQELDRQVDQDGLHEERSPGYHLIALHDLKRVIAAATVAGREIEAAQLTRYEARMERSLAQLLHPDGSMPAFHDTTSEVEPTPRDLGVEPTGEGGSYELPESGFSGWRGHVRTRPLHIVADFGAPRPSHQPGHQHAAPFAFELWWGGPVITGRGVSTYQANQQRLRERGAESHSCVTVDGQDPAEIWRAFRMGRGYEVTNRRVTTDGVRWSISGTHDGFAGRVHTRSISFDAETGTLDIEDRIEGRGHSEMKLHLPVAAPWSAERGGPCEIILWRNQDRIFLRFFGFDDATPSPAIMYRKFGEPSDGLVVIATRRDSLPSRSVVRMSLGTDA